MLGEGGVEGGSVFVTVSLETGIPQSHRNRPSLEQRSNILIPSGATIGSLRALVVASLDGLDGRDDSELGGGTGRTGRFDLLDYNPALDDMLAGEAGLRLDGSDVVAVGWIADEDHAAADQTIPVQAAVAGESRETVPPALDMVGGGGGGGGRLEAKQAAGSAAVPSAQVLDLSSLSFNVRKAVSNASPILPWLYIGGSLVSESKAALSVLRVGHVLNCCERIPFASRATNNLMINLRDIKVLSPLPLSVCPDD